MAYDGGELRRCVPTILSGRKRIRRWEIVGGPVSFWWMARVARQLDPEDQSSG
jgi:hypothetical protein